ncbi:MAG: ribonuclease HII [Pseudomonadota bacterium]
MIAVLDPEADDAFRGAVRRDCVCGVDEAGRGPLAGPVVVAAVMLDPAAPINGLADSKQLTARARERLFQEIVDTADVAVASIGPAGIARFNILGATLRGMAAAVNGLPVVPKLALFDGRDVPVGLPCVGRGLVGGDRRSPAIAAASIVAKVTRDRLMVRLCGAAPQYGFSRHKGYATPAHLAALREHGPSRFHRMGFAPVRLSAEAARGRAGTLAG